MSGALGGGALGGDGVPGNLWGTNPSGVATPQGRPAMTGGLQPLAMLQAYRAGATMDQLQAMNPYTARPTQYLPTPIATHSYAPAPVAPPGQPGFSLGGMRYDASGGPGGGDGGVGSASSDGGQDGSSAAAGGGGGGAGGK